MTRLTKNGKESPDNVVYTYDTQHSDNIKNMIYDLSYREVLIIADQFKACRYVPHVYRVTIEDDHITEKEEITREMVPELVTFLQRDLDLSPEPSQWTEPETVQAAEKYLADLGVTLK